MTIAQRGITHVRELDVAFRARIHEDVALCWVELCGCDDFCELLHVGGLDVHNICTGISILHGAMPIHLRTKRLVGYIEVPQVHAEVIRRDIGLLVRIDGNGVDVIGVCVRVDFPGHCCDNVVGLLHTWKLQVSRVGRRGYRSLVIGEVRLGHNAQ